MTMLHRPTQMTARAWWHALRDAGKAFQAKSLTDAAAALTYYSVLSIFPGLIVLVSLLGVVGSESSIEGLLRIAERPRLELGGGHAALRRSRTSSTSRAAPPAPRWCSASSPRCGRPPATSAPSCAPPTGSTTWRRIAPSTSCARCSCSMTLVSSPLVDFCYGWSLWVFLTWLPSYLSDARGFKLERWR